MKTCSTGYAKHPGGGAAIGAGREEVDDFVDTARGRNWIPTVVNPAQNGDGEQLALFWVHLLLWVSALVLSATANFGTFDGRFMGNGTNSAGYLDPDYGYGEGVSDSTKTIGLMGGLSSIVGVLFLVFAAAYYTAQEYRRAVWINVVVHVFTLYGTVASFYIFCVAATDTDEPVFFVSLLGALLMLYAQVLLYCTSATLEGGVVGLPRAFVPCFALSLQIVSYIAIRGGDFKCYSTVTSVDASVLAQAFGAEGGSAAMAVETALAGVECTDTQKTLSLLVPIFCSLAIVMMIVIRFLVNTGLETTLGKRPFLRSLVIMPFLASGLLSVYKIAITMHWSNPVAFMFTFVGMLMQFAIVGIVFVPDTALSGGPLSKG